MYHTVWQLKGEWYVQSWPHPPPSLQGTWESNYKPLKFVTRPIYSQQQEIMKQSLNLRLLFNNITREKWQLRRMTQYRRKAGSILQFSRLGPPPFPHVSPPAAEHDTTTRQNCTILFAFLGPEGAAACSSELSTSPVPCHARREFQAWNTSQFKKSSLPHISKL